jgi:hypothetical protein
VVHKYSNLQYYFCTDVGTLYTPGEYSVAVGLSAAASIRPAASRPALSPTPTPPLAALQACWDA